MAHVTTFRSKIQPGKRQALVDLMDKWEREQKAQATGFQRSVVVANNNDENDITTVVFWDTTENYNKNSERPAQDAWFQEFRSMLASEPQWFDGNIIMDRSA